MGMALTDEQNFNIVRGVGSNDELVVTQVGLAIPIVEHGGVREISDPANVVNISYNKRLETR
jgi:hypothetical protein